MQAVLVGVQKGVLPMRVKCLGEDCQGDHETYDVADVLIMSLAEPLESVEEHGYGPDSRERQEAEAQHLVLATERAIYPTMLGQWFGALTDN